MKAKPKHQTAQLAHLAKALGHPARLEILAFLQQQKNCFCGDIVEVLPLAQSTISQHLKVLKKVGLIQGKVTGTSVCYCIDYQVWEEAKKQFQSFFKQGMKSCCNNENQSSSINNQL